MARAKLPQEVLEEEWRMFREGWKARVRRWRLLLRLPHGAVGLDRVR